MAGSRLVAYERADKTWGWRLFGDNGSDIIATDGNQGYENVAEAIEMASKVVSGHYANVDQKMQRYAPPKES
ncbi:hypothetical protein [Microbacterium sp.]|uniref:hypothetical protein n=1 Tax=Microbacterium sp. TaxID=51671 RepID=UPI0028A8CE0A|nr:hypothetical protein [Microbacterium sp.]